MKYAHPMYDTMGSDDTYAELYDKLVTKMRYYIDIEDEEYFEMIEPNSMGIEGDAYVCFKIMLYVKNDSEVQYLGMVSDGDVKAQRTWIQALHDVLKDHAPTINEFNPFFIRNMLADLEEILEKEEYPTDLQFLVAGFYV